MKLKKLLSISLILCLSLNIKAQWQEVGTANDTMLLAQSPDIAIHPSTGEVYASFSQNFPQIPLVGANLTRYDGSNWKYVGTKNFTPAAVLFPNLEFNPNTNEPYMAFVDDNNSEAGTVMKYDGSSWVNVGSAGFTSDTLRGINLAFHPTTNEPYVAFSAKGDGNKISVMKYDGTNWVYVGTQAFSAADGGLTALAFHPTTYVPYVVYNDNSIGVVAQMFDGSSWTNLAAFPNLSSAVFDAEFSPSGELHVLFADYLNGKKVSLAKYNGTAWSYVGAEGFTTGASPAVSILQGEVLAFTSSGIPYVALRDDVDDNNGTDDSLIVMSYNSSSWTQVGNSLVTGASFGFSIAMSGSDEPYVVYAEQSDNFKIHVKKHSGAVVVSPPAQPTYLTVTPTSKRQAFDKMQLAWTDNANNEDGFQIERSIDNSAWNIIDSIGVDAVSYLDTGLTPETVYYYRVLAYNSGGASSYSNVDSASTGTITGIAEDISDNDFIVYPNPSSDFIAVTNLSHKNVTAIHLIDVCGKQVKQFSAENTLSLEGINPGVYSLIIHTNNQNITKRLLIH